MEIMLVLGIFSTTVLLVVSIFSTTTTLQKRTITSQRLIADARFTLETIGRETRNSTINYEFYESFQGVVGNIGWELIDPGGLPHVLALIDQDGNRTFFRRTSLDRLNQPWEGDGDRVEVCLEANICIETNPVYYSDNSGATCNSDADCSAQEGDEICRPSCQVPASWSDITPEGVRLTGGAGYPDEPAGLKFIITPAVSPYSLGSGGADYQSDEQPKVTAILVTRGLGDSADEQKINYLQTTVSSRYYGR